MMENFNQFLARKPDSNKNDFGHILIIGGDYGMGGAAIMAAEAAYRVGAGKVTLFTREENFSPLLARLPNAMTIYPQILSEEIFTNKSVIIIGCGLGRAKWGRELFEMAMKSSLPKIIDADALNILSEDQKNFDLSNSIITPHVGEAARLLNISPSEVQKDRQLSIKKLHEKFGATVILKGKGTLIYSGDMIEKCSYGNSGMSIAGMGDVLSGIVGGLVAQHLDNEKAAIYAVNIHAFAADLVAEKYGEIGMIPSDLFKYIPQIINNKI